VLAGIFVGLCDVWGVDQNIENKDDGFIVAELKDDQKKEVNAAVKERMVIKAVYKPERVGQCAIIDVGFKGKLSSIVVWNGTEGETLKPKSFSDGFPKLFYNMQQDVNHTVYFIFNSGNVDTTKDMFRLCGDLINADFTYFNTENVTDMSRMFSKCPSLSELNLSNFNTKNVSDMSSMFSDCTSLKNLDLSKFDTQNVTNMSGMFYNCTALTKLDLSSFITTNVTNMAGMFYNCSVLNKLDLSGFDTKKVKYMSSIFKGWTSFQQVFLPSTCTEKKKRCICCSDEYVRWNNHEVGGLNPDITTFKAPN
jgi:surface protein